MSRTEGCNGRSGWWSLIAYMVCAAFVGLQFTLQGAVSVMVPEIQEMFDIDMAGIGFLSSSFFFPYVFMQIPVGRLVSRHGVRRVMFLSGCLLSVSCIVFLKANAFPQAVTGRLLMGLASAAGVVSMLEVISQEFPAHRFGLLAGVMDVASMLGAALGVWLIPRGMVSIGWEAVWIFSACVALMIALASHCFLPGCNIQKSRRRTEADAFNHSVILAVLRNRKIWAVSIYGGLLFALVNSFAGMWAVPYFTLLFGDSVAVADIVSLLFVGTAIGAPLVGCLSGCRRQARRLMIVCGIACTVFLWIILYHPVSVALVSVCMLLVGVACGAYVIPFVRVKQWIGPDALPAALGMVNMIEVLIGTILFQPLIGVMLSTSGSAISIESFHTSLSVLLAGLFLAVTIVSLDGDKKTVNAQKTLATSHGR